MNKRMVNNLSADFVLIFKINVMRTDFVLEHLELYSPMAEGVFGGSYPN